MKERKSASESKRRIKGGKMETLKKLVSIVNPQRVINPHLFTPPEGFSIDSRTIKKGEGFIALRGKHFNGHYFIPEAYHKQASLVIAEEESFLKDLRLSCLVVKDSYQAMEKIALYLRKKNNPQVVGIVGSVGKTTTKEMIYFILKDKFCVKKNEKTENNILGVCKTIFNLTNHQILILELGTNSQGEIKKLSTIALPDIGVVTFIKPTHLEGLGSLEGVFKEKTSLFTVRENIKGVLNRDDNFLRKVSFLKNVFWFGLKKQCHIYGQIVKTGLEESLFLVNNNFLLRLKTSAPFFIYNALAALSVGELLGIKLKDAVESLSEFNFPPQRYEKVKIDKLIFINDCYNSNPYSLKEALKVLREYPLKKIAIIGDMLELGKKTAYYHKRISKDILKAGVDYLLIMGKYSLYLEKEIKKKGFKDVSYFSSYEGIVDFLKNLSSQEYLVFIKGSRSLKMERIISLYQQRMFGVQS